MLLAIGFSAGTLRGAETPGDAAQAVVVFAIDPRSPDAQAMIDAVRAHLTGLPVRLVVDRPGHSVSGAGAPPEPQAMPSGRVLGTISIDPATRGEWVVSFTEPAFDTTLVRRIKLRPQGTLVALEEAAIVIRSMIEALLDGGHVGIAKPAASRAAETSVGPGALTRGPRGSIAVSAGYVGTSFAAGLGWQSGASLGLRWFAAGFYVGAAYDIFPSIETDTRPASLLLIRHPGALVVGYQGSARIAPLGELGFWGDYISRYTMEIETGLARTNAQGRWSFGLALHAGICWSPLARIHVTARGGAEVVLNPYAYVVQGPVITPRVVRPRLDLGVVIDVW
jgi:hypothetical protein